MKELEEIEKQLRELVDQKQKEGYQAIDLLMKSLTEPPIPQESLIGGEKPVETSNVDLVLKSIQEVWKDVDRIVGETGLNPSQVRGVLYTKNIQNRIEVQKVGVRMVYRVKIAIGRPLPEHSGKLVP